jgi:hypothetical protein
MERAVWGTGGGITHRLAELVVAGVLETLDAVLGLCVGRHDADGRQLLRHTQSLQIGTTTTTAQRTATSTTAMAAATTIINAMAAELSSATKRQGVSAGSRGHQTTLHRHRDGLLAG